MLLGDGTCLTLDEQTTLASEYLEKNEMELKRLSEFKGASIRNLMIHYVLPDTPGLCGIPLNVNSNLAYYSLVTGISVTYLIDLEHHCP
ncbi:hypothetical protein MFFC18_18490 [Mariniblastus fucicola]|uniref:Uncharacterized protein n=1 Tax=Mariniblastus fucicola TaxID=980251 RepID=A0A5B9P6T9_9BACT|nr:hypothetical protein MFFC18_18490 [Mariniblastus fucicola]